MSKGYSLFRDLDGGSSPLPEGFSEEDVVTHVSGRTQSLPRALQSAMNEPNLLANVAYNALERAYQDDYNNDKCPFFASLSCCSSNVTFLKL